LSGLAKATICRICKENCGILVKDNGGGVEIKGNPEHPISRGFICLRGKKFGEVHASPHRLNRPLLKKGSSWSTISYKDALEILSFNLQKCKEKYGPESVVFYKGEALKHQEIASYIRHLSYGFGSPNYISVGSLCYHSTALAYESTMGQIPLPDFENMKAAVAWGANPLISAPLSSVALRKAIKRGAKLLVIDPCRTETAKLAHLHIPIIPGSDGLLALALIKYALEKHHLKPASPAPWWNEMESLVRGVPYLHFFQEIGIDGTVFQEAAALLFDSLPAYIHTGSGLELKPNGVQTIRAVAALQSILYPSGGPLPFQAALSPLPGMNRYPDMPDPIGYRQFPWYIERSREAQGMCLNRAILYDDPYPVRAMVVAGGNPLLTFPGSNIYRKAFERLDFLAVFDLFLTPTAQYAHLVFPAADFLESLDLHDYGPEGRPYLGLVQPVAPGYGGWTAAKFVFELARSLNLGNLFPWPGEKEAIEYRLAASGAALEDLKKSPSATLAYAPSDSPLRCRNTPAPGAVSPSEPRKKPRDFPLLRLEDFHLPLVRNQDFPFWLSTGDRVACYQHSQFRSSPGCRSVMPEPAVEIHPDSAEALSVRQGEPVVISTRYGAVTVSARLNPDVDRNCLKLSHGWIQANANELTDSEYFDPLSGFPWLKALPARIEKKVR
jgi:anaerobic selenocysteine-containing dehydrogenase